MFKFIRLAFIALLSFSELLVRVAKISKSTKSVSLNNESRLARPTLIDLNSNLLHSWLV